MTTTAAVPIAALLLLTACGPDFATGSQQPLLGERAECLGWAEPDVAMPHDSIIRSAGLYTNVNPLDAPSGAMLRADDVVVDQLGVVCPRRGQATDGTLAAAPNAWGLYESTLFAALANNTVSRYSGGAGTNLGTFNDPPNGKRRFAEVARNLFFSSATGTKRIDGASGTPVQSGVDQPGQGEALVNKGAPLSATVGTALAGGRTVAYRFVHLRFDSRGREIRSVPSNRLLVTNWTIRLAAGFLSRAANVVTGTFPLPTAVTSEVNIQNGDTIFLESSDPAFPSGAKVLSTVAFSGFLGGSTYYTFTYPEVAANATSTIDVTATPPTRDVNLTIPILSDRRPGDRIEVYRTPSVPEGVSPPDATMGKVYEEITLPVAPTDLTVRDNVPDVLVGDRLYTSIEGLEQANWPPPVGGDAIHFKRHLVISNVTEKHRLHVRLLAVGGASGLQNPDDITIAGVAYRSGVDFITFTFGSVSLNIERTARNIVAAVNARAQLGTSPVWGRYVSGDNDAPGMMVFEAVAWNAAQFAMTASAHGSAWEPVLPTVGTAVSSSNDPVPNGMRICKADEPDHCPLDNEVVLGSSEQSILRSAALDDTIIVFTTKGVFWVRWSQPDLSDLDSGVIDAEMVLTAPESVVRLSNWIYALTNFGVVRIGERGWEHISEPLDDQILKLYAQYGPSLANAHGVGYPTDKKYLLWLPVFDGDGSAQQALVWNDRTKTWTRRTDAATAGIIASDGKLVLGTAAGAVTRERKALSDADYFNPNIADPYTTVMEWLAPASRDPSTEKNFQQVMLHFLEPQSGTFTMEYQPDYLGVYYSAAEQQAQASAVFRAWTLDEARLSSRMTWRVTRDTKGKKFNLVGVGFDHEVASTNTGAAPQP